jgi:hypothetical protein
VGGVALILLLLFFVVVVEESGRKYDKEVLWRYLFTFVDGVVVDRWVV